MQIENMNIVLDFHMRIVEIQLQNELKLIGKARIWGFCNYLPILSQLASVVLFNVPAVYECSSNERK